MGDQNRGPLPCQAAGNGGGIAHQVGIHAGEGFVHQQRLGILAQQGAQQGGAALLPAGKPHGRQAQVSLGKAKGSQVAAGLGGGQTVACQHKVVYGSQLGAKTVLLKDDGRGHHAGEGAAVGGLQP